MLYNEPFFKKKKDERQKRKLPECVPISGKEEKGSKWKTVLRRKHVDPVIVFSTCV